MDGIFLYSPSYELFFAAVLFFYKNLFLIIFCVADDFRLHWCSNDSGDVKKHELNHFEQCLVQVRGLTNWFRGFWVRNLRKNLPIFWTIIKNQFWYLVLPLDLSPCRFICQKLLTISMVSLWRSLELSTCASQPPKPYPGFRQSPLWISHCSFVLLRGKYFGISKDALGNAPTSRGKTSSWSRLS